MLTGATALLSSAQRIPSPNPKTHPNTPLSCRLPPVIKITRSAHGLHLDCKAVCITSDVGLGRAVVLMDWTRSPAVAEKPRDAPRYSNIFSCYADFPEINVLLPVKALESEYSKKLSKKSRVDNRVHVRT